MIYLVSVDGLDDLSVDGLVDDISVDYLDDIYHLSVDDLYDLSVDYLSVRRTKIVVVLAMLVCCNRVGGAYTIVLVYVGVGAVHKY